MKWKPLFALGIAALIVVGCSAERKTAPNALAPADVDKFIASQKGKVVLVNFWATWCGPCRLEMPGFVELQKKYGSQGLQIVGLSIDDLTAAEMDAFAKKNGINYPLLLVGQDTMKAWGSFEAIPMTFLLDTQGKKVWQLEGAADTEVFEKQIKPLLPKQAS